MLVSPERSSHYYRATDQGVEPYYEMRGKNGKMRAPRIDDARELNLLVSISRIAGMLPKPALNAWLQSQAIISALTLPRKQESFSDYDKRYLMLSPDDEDPIKWCYLNPPKPLEEVDAFAKRVVEDMEAQGKAAMSFGTALHAQIERELINRGSQCIPELEPFMVSVRAWIDENVARVIGVEQVVGNVELGIGGKLDLHCELTWEGNPIGVVDFKTSAVKNGKPGWYPEWFLQLCGYSHCVKEKGAYETWPCLLSIVVDSKVPGPVHVKQWENPEYGWEIFLHCFEIFCYVNNYRPGKL